MCSFLHEQRVSLNYSLWINQLGREMIYVGRARKRHSYLRKFFLPVFFAVHVIALYIYGRINC